VQFRTGDASATGDERGSPFFVVGSRATDTRSTFSSSTQRFARASPLPHASLTSGPAAPTGLARCSILAAHPSLRLGAASVCDRASGFPVAHALSCTSRCNAVHDFSSWADVCGLLRAIDCPIRCNPSVAETRAKATRVGRVLRSGRGRRFVRAGAQRPRIGTDQAPRARSFALLHEHRRTPPEPTLLRVLSPSAQHRNGS